MVRAGLAAISGGMWAVHELVVAGAGRSPGCGEDFAHHRAIGLAPGHDLEAMLGEDRRDPQKQVAGVAGHGGVDGVGLQGRGVSRGGHANGSANQRSHHALAAVGAPHVKARQRPHRQVIHRPEVPATGQPVQIGPRGKLAPADAFDAPARPNRSSSAGHCPAVTGRTVRSITASLSSFASLLPASRATCAAPGGTSMLNY